MRIGVNSSGGYAWFERVIKIIDVLSFLNKQEIEDIQKLTVEELDAAIYTVQTKISATALSKMHSVQTNALMAFNMWNGQINAASVDDNRNWMIISLNNFRQASVSASVSVKTPDYLVITTIIRYLGRDVWVYSVYDANVTVPELRDVPLDIFVLYKGVELYCRYPVSEIQVGYELQSKNNVVLHISDKTGRVLACFPKETIDLKETAAEIIASVLNDMKLLEAPNKVASTRDIAMMRIKRIMSGIVVTDYELKWVCNTFNLHHDDAVNYLDKILKTAAKGRVIDVFGNKFETIDIMRYRNNILMIRTSFFDESSQLVMLFEISQAIETVAFFIVDVFPHEGINGTKYTVSNNIKSSSRQNVIGSSRVTVIAGNDITVVEDISIRYRDVEIHISDSINISSEDDEDSVIGENPEDKEEAINELKENDEELKDGATEVVEPQLSSMSF